MKYKWLNKEDSNNKLLLFFNGWGMDENVVKHLDREDYNVLMFYDYNSLETDFDFKSLDTYQEKNLIAWSMGVMVATNFIKYLSKISHSVAINGTLKPIDIKFGIHPKIYDLTIKGFNETGKEKFINSMFENNISPSSIFPISRTLEEQVSELIAIKNYQSDKSFKYNKILISDNDKIIPTKTQVAFWGIEPNLKGGHCPFLQFKKWSELL